MCIKQAKYRIFLYSFLLALYNLHKCCGKKLLKRDVLWFIVPLVESNLQGMCHNNGDPRNDNSAFQRNFIDA